MVCLLASTMCLFFPKLSEGLKVQAAEVQNMGFLCRNKVHNLHWMSLFQQDSSSWGCEEKCYWQQEGERTHNFLLKQVAGESIRQMYVIIK